MVTFAENVDNIASYIVIFLIELFAAYILWFILKKIIKTTKLYRIAIICLVISLGVGYVASYRMVGYDVTMDYLTRMNDQRIEETGRSITLQEENEHKEILSQTKEFRTYLRNESTKISLYPFILVIFIMLLSARRAVKKLPQKDL